MGLPPAAVNGKQRNIAWLIYALLVAGWLAYSIYFIVTQVQERDSPPVQSSIKKLKYLQPRYALCSFDPTISFLEPVCEIKLGKATRNCSAVYQTITYTAADASTLSSTDIEGFDPSVDAPIDIPPDDGSDAFSDDNSTNNSSSIGYALQDLENPASSAFQLQTNTTVNANASKPLLYCMVFNNDRKTVLRPRTDMLNFETDFEIDPASTGGVLALSLFIYETDIEKSDEFLVPFNKKSALVVQKSTYKSFRQATYATFDTSIVSLDLDPSSVPQGASTIQIRVKISDYNVEEIVEVDPVSATLIMGTISGFWNLVGIAFALFFVKSKNNKDELELRTIDKNTVKKVLSEKAKETFAGNAKEAESDGA